MLTEPLQLVTSSKWAAKGLHMSDIGRVPATTCLAGDQVYCTQQRPPIEHIEWERAVEAVQATLNYSDAGTVRA